MDNVIIVGGSGFIGRHLADQLLANGYQPIVLTRNRNCTFDAEIKKVVWDGCSIDSWCEHAQNAKVIVNLAGENIASGRWNTQKKKRILESRINATQAVADAVKVCKEKGVPTPQVIQASAIGFYGENRESLLDENSKGGDGFLANVCKAWENSATPIGEITNLSIVRIGAVLGTNGGALEKIMPLFKYYGGGHPGKGTEIFSWIHIDDLCKIILFLIHHREINGIFNATAPQPVPAKTFYRILGQAMGRPSWLHPPRFILKLIVGEMAESLILSSLHVLPKRIANNGFKFSYPTCRDALTHLATKRN